MRRSPPGALVVLLAAASLAEARPLTTSMTCAQATAMVTEAGGIVLSTGPYTYDRFVANNGFCPPGQTVERATAPTLDSPYCPLGYTCEERRRRVQIN